MRLDIARIDDRIRKLNELRALISDPEMQSLLLDCLTSDDLPRASSQAPDGDRSGPVDPDEARILAGDIVKGAEPERQSQIPAGAGLFRRR